MTLEDSGLGDYFYSHSSSEINLLVLGKKMLTRREAQHFCILLRKVNEFVWSLQKLAHSSHSHNSSLLREILVSKDVLMHDGSGIPFLEFCCVSSRLPC